MMILGVLIGVVVAAARLIRRRRRRVAAVDGGAYQPLPTALYDRRDPFTGRADRGGF